VGCVLGRRRTDAAAGLALGARRRTQPPLQLGWTAVSPSDSTGQPSLAVVTVTYSPGEHLEHFISTLATATAEKPQVILADNGSVDGVPEMVAEANSHVRLLRTGGNIGYGGAINRAVAELDPSIEFIVISNPDIRWGNDAIDELLAAAQRWPRAGALGPMVREPDGSVYPSARSVPGLLDGAGHAILGSIWKSKPWTVDRKSVV